MLKFLIQLYSLLNMQVEFKTPIYAQVDTIPTQINFEFDPNIDKKEMLIKNVKQFNKFIRILEQVG